MPSLKHTSCCALEQINVWEDPPESIWDRIKSFEASCRRNYGRDSEPQAFFAVTKPTEKKSEKSLKSLGFKKLVTFPRCPNHLEGYGRAEPATLNMWFATRAELMEPKKAKK